MAEFQFTPSFLQPVTGDGGNLRLTGMQLQPVYYQLTAPNVAFSASFLQAAYYQQLAPNLLASAFFIQYLQRAPDTDMSSDVYPTLRGLTFQTSAKPMFSTGISEHTSGKETRTSYWEHPRWQFQLQYDYLPNKSTAANTDFKTLVGFFCSRAGAYDNFLFSAPDDNYAESVQLGVGDGDTVEYAFFRPFGTYQEPVGQVDVDNVAVWVNGPETATIPSASPYTVTLQHQTDVSGVSVSGFTKVSGTPAQGQYSYDPTTFTLAFNSADKGTAITVNYKYKAIFATDFSITLPRTLVFTVAPPTGAVVTSSFNYFFVCRFLEDSYEFDQFYEKLWELGQIDLKSEIT